MSGHLSEIALNSFVDDELSPSEAREAEAHLAECAACATSALSQMMLKRATAQAGRRYELPTQGRKRLASGGPKSPAPSTPGWIGWSAAIAALLIVVAGIGAMQRRSAERVEEAALVTELTDQHVSGMAANQPPEVLSSDRHTVKPWFQGKIPFSFNLPEGLPGDTTLDGANLVYQGHRPVAQLLYSIGKHRVSVFVREISRDDQKREMTTEQSGFHVAALHTGELYILAVSDVDPARLTSLATAIRNAQSQN